MIKKKKQIWQIPALFMIMLNGSAISVGLSCWTSNYVLFQPFHFRHTLPGFSLSVFLRLSQKAASFLSASLLKGFFILSSPPSFATSTAMISSYQFLSQQTREYKKYKKKKKLWLLYPFGDRFKLRGSGFFKELKQYRLCAGYHRARITE